MTPEGRMTWTLIATLAMWSPVAIGLLGGQMDISIGGLYFIGALILSYVSTGIVGSLLKGYRDHATRAEQVKRQIEEIERRNTADTQQEERARRSDD